MKHKYRIYILGVVPPDLRERIASIHGSAILNSRDDRKPVHTQNLDSQKKKLDPKTT
jgi:hypothetical protein